MKKLKTIEINLKYNKVRINNRHDIARCPNKISETICFHVQYNNFPHKIFFVLPSINELEKQSTQKQSR